MRPPPPPPPPFELPPAAGGFGLVVVVLDAATVIVPVSLAAFASLDESSARPILSDPASVAVKVRSIWRVSPAGSAPSVHVAVPAPLVQLPPFAVTD
jgi:hypothetical protein